MALPTAEWPAAEAERGLRGLLASFPRLALRVAGGCMAPAIPEGATVLLEDARRRRPRFGDVVLVRQAAGLRLHRLIWTPPRGAWRTKADRGPLADPPLARDAVLARVVGARRRLSALLSLLGALRRRLS